MSELALLAVMGSVEGVVYLMRYRSATGRSALVSAAHTLLLGVLRVLFVTTGAKAAMDSPGLVEAAWICAAYAVPAAVSTGVAHEWAERRKGRRSSDGV